MIIYPAPWSLQMILEHHCMISVRCFLLQDSWNSKMTGTWDNTKILLCSVNYPPISFHQFLQTHPKAFQVSSCLDAIAEKEDIWEDMEMLINVQTTYFKEDCIPWVDQHFRKQFHRPRLACTYKKIFLQQLIVGEATDNKKSLPWNRCFETRKMYTRSERAQVKFGLQFLEVFFLCNLLNLIILRKYMIKLTHYIHKLYPVNQITTSQHYFRLLVH